MASSADTFALPSSVAQTSVQQQTRQGSTQDSTTETEAIASRRPTTIQRRSPRADEQTTQTDSAPQQTSQVQAAPDSKPIQKAPSGDRQPSASPAPPLEEQPATTARAQTTTLTIDNRLHIPLIEVYLVGSTPRDKLILHVTLTMLIAWAVQFLLRIVTFVWGQERLWKMQRGLEPVAAICSLGFFLAYFFTEPFLLLAFYTKKPFWATLYIVRNCVNAIWLFIFPIIAISCPFAITGYGCVTFDSARFMIGWLIITWLEAIFFLGFIFVSSRFRDYLTCLKLGYCDVPSLKLIL